MEIKINKIFFTLLEWTLIFLSIYFCVISTSIYLVLILYPLMISDEANELYTLFFYTLPFVILYGAWVTVYIFYKPLRRNVGMSVYLSVFIIILSVIGYWVIDNLEHDTNAYTMLEPLSVILFISGVTGCLFFIQVRKTMGSDSIEKLKH